MWTELTFNIKEMRDLYKIFYKNNIKMNLKKNIIDISLTHFIAKSICKINIKKQKKKKSSQE